MTLKEIQEAINTGKSVVDEFGNKILFACEKGFLLESADTQRWVSYPEAFKSFSIKDTNTWPQIGDKYYKIQFEGTHMLFAEWTWEDRHFEKKWLKQGTIFRDKEEALSKIKEFIESLV